MHSGSHPGAGGSGVLTVMGAARLRRMDLPTGQGSCLKDALEAKLRLLIGLLFPRRSSRTQSASFFRPYQPPVDEITRSLR